MIRKVKLIKNHGGAWKVAYADLTTSMMALFMVLWILSQDEEVIIATTQFFRDPYKAGVPKSTPVEQPDGRKGSMVDQILGRSDSTMRNTNDTSSIDISILYQMATAFYKNLKMEDITDEAIEIDVTSDGLRLTIFDKNETPLFQGDSGEFTSWGEMVMQNLAWSLERHDMRVRIDAHTNQFDKGSENTEWEVSFRQANAAGDKLTHYALDPSKIERITSFANTMPLDKENLKSERNRRLEISLVLEKE